MKEQIFMISCRSTELFTPLSQGHGNCFGLKSFSHYDVWKKTPNGGIWHWLIKELESVRLLTAERYLLACPFLQYLYHILFVMSSAAQIVPTNNLLQVCQLCNSLAKSLTHFSTSGSFIALIKVAVVINSKILKN